MRLFAFFYWRLAIRTYFAFALTQKKPCDIITVYFSLFK